MHYDPNILTVNTIKTTLKPGSLPTLNQKKPSNVQIQIYLFPKQERQLLPYP